MKTIKESSIVRVRRVRRTPPRQRWRERLLAGEMEGHRRLSENDFLSHRHLEECSRQDDDEREPDAESCSLRYSNDEEGGSCSGHVKLMGNRGPQPLDPCSSANDYASVGRIPLVGLLRPHESQLVSGDVNSVHQSFQTLSVARSRRRVLGREKSCATRRRILMNTLGMEIFYQALALVKEVKECRQKILQSCSISGEDPNRPGLITSVVCKHKVQHLLRPAKDLLVNTKLVSSLEHTMIHRLGRLPWDGLISQARDNLMAYREWLSLSETRE